MYYTQCMIQMKYQELSDSGYCQAITRSKLSKCYGLAIPGARPVQRILREKKALLRTSGPAGGLAHSVTSNARFFPQCFFSPADREARDRRSDR